MLLNGKTFFPVVLLLGVFLHRQMHNCKVHQSEIRLYQTSASFCFWTEVKKWNIFLRSEIFEFLYLFLCYWCEGEVIYIFDTVLVNGVFHHICFCFCCLTIDVPSKKVIFAPGSLIGWSFIYLFIYFVVWWMQWTRCSSTSTFLKVWQDWLFLIGSHSQGEAGIKHGLIIDMD